MLIEALKSIKSEKKMSLNHWRYRILHWAFGCRPKTQWASPLPRFLYTHYCPLFHLTNLIILFSPIILMVKMIIGLVFVGGSIVMVCANASSRLHARFRPPVETTPETEEKIRARYLQKCRNTLPKYMAKLHPRYLVDFDTFWGRYLDEYWQWHISKGDVEEIYNFFLPKIHEAQERAEEKRERTRERIVFWVNFSRVFVKFLLNATYLVVAGLLAYATWLWGWPVAKFIGSFIATVFVSFFTFDFLGFLWFVFMLSAQISIACIVLGAVVIGCYKFVPFRKACLAVVTPVAVSMEALGGFIEYLGGLFYSAYEFVGLFYEQNCPPIVIVKDEEALMAEIEDKL